MDAPKFHSVGGLIEAAEDRATWNSLTNSMCPVVRKQRKKNQSSIDILVASGCATKMQEELIFKG